MAKRIKTGGREQGTPNVITSEIRERINKIIESNFDENSIEQDLKTLDPEKRLIILIKLLEFSLPKLQATRIEADLSDHLVNIRPKEWI